MEDFYGKEDGASWLELKKRIILGRSLSLRGRAGILMQITSSSFGRWRRPLWQITSLAQTREFPNDQLRHFLGDAETALRFGMKSQFGNLTQVMSFQASAGFCFVFLTERT